MGGAAGALLLAVGLDVKRVVALGDPTWSRRLLPAACTLHGDELVAVFTDGKSDWLCSYSLSKETAERLIQCPDLPSSSASLAGRFGQTYVIAGSLLTSASRKSFEVGVPNPLTPELRNHPFVALAGTTVAPVDTAMRPWILIGERTSARLIVDDLPRGVPVHATVSGDLAEVWIASDESGELHAVRLSVSQHLVMEHLVLSDEVGEAGRLSLANQAVYISRVGEVEQYTRDGERLVRGKRFSVSCDSAIIRQRNGGVVAVGTGQSGITHDVVEVVTANESVRLVLTVMNDNSAAVLLDLESGLSVVRVGALSIQESGPS